MTIFSHQILIATETLPHLFKHVYVTAGVHHQVDGNVSVFGGDGMAGGSVLTQEFH
jgi:hypothetical protein